MTRWIKEHLLTRLMTRTHRVEGENQPLSAVPCAPNPHNTNK